MTKLSCSDARKKHFKAVYTTEKFGSGPIEKAVRTHNFCKETLQDHRRL